MLFNEWKFCLIPKAIFKKVGFLNKVFTHNYGDIDYGLRTIKNNFKIYIASEVIGLCDKNELELWRKPNSRFLQRLKSLYESKNFIAHEVMYFQLIHYGFFAFLKHFIGVFIIICSPKIYYKLSKFYVK